MVQPVCGTQRARKVSPCRNPGTLLLALHLCSAPAGCAARRPDAGSDLPTGSITRVITAGTSQRPGPAGSSARRVDDPAGLTSLTLEEAVRRAVAFSPNIRQAQGRLAEQAEQVNVARAGYLPRVQGGLASGLDSDNDGTFEPSATLSASQMIFDFGKVASAVDAATAGKAMRDTEVLLETDAVIKDTADAVIEVQRNSALAGAAAEQVAGLSAIGTLVRQRVEKGGSSRSDQTQTDARIEAAQATLLQYETQRARWQETLGYLLGGVRVAKVAAAVPAWLADACDEPVANIDQVPRLVRADAERRQAVANLRQSRAQALPTLSLKGDASYDLLGRGAGEPLRYNIGLAATGSLYEGGATTARRRAAAHREAAAKSAIETARLEVGRDLAQARSETAGLKQLLPAYATRRKWSRETRDLYQRQYLDLGTKTLLDLLNAEFELHAVEFERIDAEHDLRKLGIGCIFDAGMARASFGLGGPDAAASAKTQRMAAR